MSGEAGALGNPAAPPSDPGQGQGAAGGAPPAAAASSISIPDNWKDAIPEEFRKDPSMDVIKTVEDLSKSYIHAQKMIGKDKVIVPDAKFATDKDWSEFYRKVGLPSELKDYKVTPPKDAQIDDGYFKEFVEQAHKSNIMPAQAQKMLEWHLAKEQQMMAEGTQKALGEITQQLEGYKKQVGAAYDKKVMFANKTLESFGGPEMMKMFASNPSIGNNPLFIETLSKIGEKLFGEDTFDGDSRVKGAMTPEEARSKRNEVMGNPQHPYWMKDHPKHQESVDFVNKLFEYENPS